MKNVFPPVIENLLKWAKESQTAHYSGRFNEKVFDKCAEVIRAVETYKKQLEQDDLISLFIESRGDRKVGINSEQIEIRMWRGYIRPDNMLRKEVKELFKDAVEPLFATNVSNIRFEDECSECGSLFLDEKDCPVTIPLNKIGNPDICSNKNCISNMLDEN